MRIKIKQSLLAVFFIAACMPSWAEFYASKAGETTYDNSPALIIRLTDALAEDTILESYVDVTPALTNGNRWITLDGGYSWTLPFVEPNTKYDIYFKRSPVSVNGEDFKRVSITNENWTHYSDSWIVTTEPLSPSANFAQSGQYLSTNAQEALPITVVNVDAIALDIFRVRDDQLDDFLRRTYYSGITYYDSLNQLKKWADLVHTSQYEFDLRRHKRETINLDISAATSKHDNGVYIAILRKTDTYEYQFDTTLFTRSDIGMHSRFMATEAQTQVNSITTGEPLEGIDVSYFWTESNNQLIERTATSDENGLSVLTVFNQPSLVVARKGNQVSFLKPQQNNLDLSAYANVPARHQSTQGFFYGPRDLYRPGETVNINMLMRDFDGQTTANTPVNMGIYDARGSQVDNFIWRADESGSYRHEFTLDTNAPTGNWSLRVLNDTPFNGNYSFQVEEFLPERMSMSFYDNSFEKYRYIDSRTGIVPINVQYLYGAPAAGNRADAVVSVSIATDLFEQWSDHSFGDPTENISPETKKLDEINLDDQGDGQLKISSDWSQIESPIKYRVTASAYEEGGRPVTRSQTVISISPSTNNKTSTFIGVDPLFKDRPKTNQLAKFHLISVNTEGVAQADKADVQLVRKNRDYYWYYDDSDGWNRRWRGDSYVAWSKELSLTEKGLEIELPLQWGDYEIHVKSSTGNKTVYPFRTQYYWSNSTSNSLQPEVIDIILDQDHYQPGENALIRFNSATAGRGILQVESREGIVHSQPFTAVEGDNEINLTVPEDWNRHDLYLTLMVLSPADQTTELAPKRTLGISHFPIRRADAEFDVTVEAPVKIEPNTTVTATVTVNNPETAHGERIWATVAMVDMGVLNITKFKRPQPEQFFFAPRRFESIYLDMYGKVINNLGLKTFKQKFGGGFADSDQELARGGDQPQSEIQIISFFSDPVEIIDGHADVSFDVPSFNGRVKWMVVTWSEATYGSEETEMTIADKLVTQISAPRFLAMGDQSQLTLDLHNLSGNEQTFEVALSVTGSVVSKYPGETLQLADKEKQSLVIPIEGVDFTGQGVIKLNVSNGDDINISREWKIGVRAPFPLRTLRARKVIEPGEVWEIDPVTEHLYPETIKAQLTVSDRPAINFNEHVDYLLRYPYGCLEQTISSTYPWVLIDEDLFKQLNMAGTFERRFDKDFSDTLRREQIESGITRLLKKQKTDGSFGYWNVNSSASMWGTSYATELLQDAQKTGVQVDNNRLINAYNALSRMMRGSTSADIWTDDASSYQVSYRAYAAYVLARGDKASLTDLRRLFTQMTEQNTSHSPLPWMHMAVALKTAGDKKLSKQAAEKAKEVKRTYNRYYADYGSTTRDISLSLALALEHGITYGDWEEDLEVAMSKRRWFSTQERIALVRLAKAYSNDGNEWKAKLVANSFTQTLEQTQPFNTVINGEQLADLQSIASDDKRLYATLLWQGVPNKVPTAYQHGMTITRQYYSLDGSRLDLSKPVRSGDLIIARINAQSLEHRYPEALIVDLLPAGFELENQNLLNASVDLDSVNIEGQSVGDYFRNYRVDFQEYRDDRFVAAVKLYSHTPTTLFYLVRAVTPGKYALPNSYVEDMYRPENQAMGHSPGTVIIQPAR